MIEIRRTSHEGGEYRFTPDALALSLGHHPCRVEMRFDGRSWDGTSLRGDLKVMPVGQERVFRHRDRCSFTFIALPCARIPRGSELRPHAILRDAPLRHVIDALLAENALGRPGALFQEAISTAIVARLRELDRCPRPQQTRRLPPAALARVIDYLEAHLADDVSVAELAAVAGLSPSHFSELFRNAIGEPPHRYHTRLRVQRARQLIESGTSVSDAALEVGFFDQSHLTRHMRRLLGTRPGELRRAARGAVTVMDGGRAWMEAR
ncbi:MAG TPA: AraC family transcriptional regulator [Vicinamibacterales bacterium]